MDLAPAERITAWLIELPMSHAFVSARTSVTQRRLIVVLVEQAGIVGWGEAAPVAGHTKRSVDALWASLRLLLAAHGTAAVKHGDGLLRAAFQQAADDVGARRLKLPLWQALGSTPSFAASAAVGVDESGQPDRTQVIAAAAAGYVNVKLKLTPATDPAAVERLVQEHGQITFGADANGSLGPDDLELLDGLDSLGLGYLEQPGDPSDLRFHRDLRRRLQTPIALDESATMPRDIVDILDMEAADIVTLKAGRTGASVVLQQAEQITASGVGARLGGLLESGIGRAHSAAVAGHPLFEWPGDVAGSDRYFADDLVRPQWRTESGMITAPDSPGIGVAVDIDALTAHAVATLSSVDSG